MKIMMTPCTVKKALYVAGSKIGGVEVNCSTLIRTPMVTATSEENRQRDQVEDSDPLVVGGQQPSHQPLAAALIQIAADVRRCRLALSLSFR